MTTNESEARQDEREARQDEPGARQDKELLVGHDAGALDDRWQQIQAEFVDRPREAVQEADALVRDLFERITAGFAQERERLERQWDGGDDVSTEDLRMALQRYRAFFGRLLSV